MIVVTLGKADVKETSISPLIVGTYEPSQENSLNKFGFGDEAKSDLADTSPLATSFLERELSKTSLGQLKDDFVTRSNKVEPAGRFVVPENVNYGKRCRGLCEASTPRSVLGMESLLHELWATAFDAAKVNTDVLMVCEVYVGIDSASPPEHVEFCTLTSAMSRSSEE